MKLFRNILLILIIGAPLVAGQRAMTVTDMMTFRDIETPVLSRDGQWLAYGAWPDRGDGEVHVQRVNGDAHYVFSRGAGPQFSNNGQWVAMTRKPPAVAMEKNDKDKPKPGMIVLNTAHGDTLGADNVDRFVFSENSLWLAYLLAKEDDAAGGRKDTSARDSSAAPKKAAKKNTGGTLVLHPLREGIDTRIPYVVSFAFDTLSHYLAYAVADTGGTTNGVYCIDLTTTPPGRQTLAVLHGGAFTSLTWNTRTGTLAFVAAPCDEKENPMAGSLWLWRPGSNGASEAVGSPDSHHDWMVPSKNELTWSMDGRRLFLGFREREDTSASEKKDTSVASLLDIDALLKKREVDVWHWNDPLINPNQKKQWKDEKNHLYRAVYDVASGRTVPLADSSLPEVFVPRNRTVALGRSILPYRKEITWDDTYYDYNVVSLQSGTRTRVLSHHRSTASLSPEGTYIVYFRDRQWHAYDVAGKRTRDLTARLPVQWDDEEDDTPDPAAEYGIAGWVEGDAAVLLYDRYDIWQVPLDGGMPVDLTAGDGRACHVVYRIQKLDKARDFYRKGEELLLTAYYDLLKHTALYGATVGKKGVRKWIEEPARFTVVGKATDADVLLFSRETHSEFPDLWVSNLHLTNPTKVTTLGMQTEQFAMGTAELVAWSSLDGVPLQGVLIRPGNYEPGKKYPVLVYYYERSSQRLYEFNQIVVNHRPCFPYYASNGYALFLPDVVYDIGQPGYSATKCIVPGVQKLIAMGIADPKAIALHGHSWSGYQTAFVVTQTNIFAAAIAGAPVSNMTSAYDGIRWGPGIARQFQYEQSQSRIGGSLWEYPERYIENSPVFFADRITTPLLIEHGDDDEAVPWYQSIELYLAMRRLGKNCIFLQYRGEPHHLKKYPNKVDYTVKMKEYLDHYLKGAPAADWITRGVPYRE